jgi:protein-S-isoprenylcysteine O-methyltransferase Ste14
VAAKISFGICWGFPLLPALSLYTPAGVIPPMRAAGVLIMLMGAAIAVAAMAHLGESLALGLPATPHGLRTRGLYVFSRNPIYLGALVACAGSCLYSPHIINILSLLAAATLHAWIVRREEDYLEAAYGEAWREYARRTPRWLGVRRGTRPA